MPSNEKPPRKQRTLLDVPVAKTRRPRPRFLDGQFDPAHAITGPALDFALALDRYKREQRRPFPTASEVLDVLLSLGYRLVAEPGPLPVPRMVK